MSKAQSSCDWISLSLIASNGFFDVIESGSSIMAVEILCLQIECFDCLSGRMKVDCSTLYGSF
jgi:hypothetical protein